MINWSMFKNNLLTYFNSNVNSKTTQDPSDVASYIAGEYEKVITTSVFSLNFSIPISGYTILSWLPTNTNIIKTGIENSLRAGMTLNIDMAAITYTNIIWASLLASWIGIQVSLIPIPVAIGFGTVTLNSVIMSGFPSPSYFIKFKENANTSEFVDEFINLFSNHLKTITGQVVGTTPPSPTPVPLVMPWVGLQ